MKAQDLMTTDVVSVSPEAPVGEIARVLLARHVSAVPVVDNVGTVVGMVSEGDLIGRDQADRIARRDWWLALLADGDAGNPDLLSRLHGSPRTARDVMSSPVIGVAGHTEASEIAGLLLQYRIKRVPVLDNGKLIGIVSRADLLRALADGDQAQAHEEGRDEGRQPRTGGLIANAIARLDHRFFGPRNGRPGGKRPEAKVEGDLSVADFHSLMTDFAHHKAEQAVAAQREASARRRERVKELIDEHVCDEGWKAMLHRARDAAERGAKEYLLLRFPSDLCIDGGRAINATLPDWPRSLRGEAAEIYLRWERELKPCGFHLSARVLDYPRGMPGDVGLFLGWAE